MLRSRFCYLRSATACVFRLICVCVCATTQAGHHSICCAAARAFVIQDCSLDRRFVAGPRAMGDEEADLLALIGIGQVVQAPAPRRYAPQSWQLLEKARAAKALKRARLSTEEEAERRAEAEGKLDVVASQSSQLAQLVGISPTRRPMDLARAALVAKLAFMPAIRGRAGLRQSQGQAVHLAAMCVVQAQQRFVETVFKDLAPAPADGRAPSFRAHVLHWQWDETSQHLASMPVKAMKGERSSFSGQGVQVMMQSGRLCVYQVVSGIGEHIVDEPFFCRALFLQRLTSDDMIAGLLRRLPFNIADTGVVNELSNRCDVFVLAFTMDRASANYGVLHWLFAALCAQGMPRNVLPFAEPCVPHGIALVKNRLCIPGSIVPPSHTLSALMRGNKFVCALRDVMLSTLRGKLNVVRAPRPQTSVEESLRLAGALLGDLDADWLYTRGPDGARVPGALLRDVQTLVGTLELGDSSGAVTHWCYICEGSPEHRAGGRVGDACCATPEDALEKLAVPVVNLLLQRPWSRSSENRWTYVVVTLRRIALGFITSKVLPDSLRELKTHWGLSEAMVPMLERIVAADQGDFPGASKLRLLRVCRSLCAPEAAFTLGVQLIVLSQVDGLLYECLGDNRKRGATLSQMLDLRTSPVARAEQGLCDLLADWRPASPGWRLLAALGCNFGGLEEAMRARSAVLGLCAALYDLFVLRFSQPPYTLLRLADPAAEASERLAVSTDFLARPDHCLSVFCRRLRDRCPSPQALMQEAPHIMTALSHGLAMGVDYTERSHATMRQELRTGGRARSGAVAANRVIVQQTRAEHMQRCGVDPARAKAAPPGAAAALAPEPPPGQIVPAQRAATATSRRGGNAAMSWRNNKLAVFKRTHAPHRPLTAEELSRFRAAAAAEWAALPEEMKQQWRLVWQGEREERFASPAPVPEEVAQRDFAPLWGGPKESGCPLPLEDVMRLHNAASYVKRREQARKDPELLLDSATVPQRVSGPADMRSMFCCWSQRKNVCRLVLQATLASEVDLLTARLNNWVDKLGAASARECGHLLWLQGQGRGDSSEARGRRQDACVALLDSRARPKMQIFARCTAPGNGQGIFFTMPDFPVALRLATGGSTISARFQALSLCTSDTLCLELAQLGMDWAFRPLVWSLVEGSGNLLDMLATSAEEPLQFQPKARRPRCPKVAPEFAVMASLEKDLRAETPGAPPSSNERVPGALDAEAADADQAQEFEGAEFEQGDFGELPEDVVADVLAEFGRLFGEEEMGDDFLEPAAADGEGDDQTEDAALLAEDLEAQVAAAEGSPAESSGEGAGEALDPAVVAAAAATISPTGYVSSSAGAWSEVAMVGRITTWPAHKPEETRSVSCRCYVHTNCRSPARRRFAITNEDLLRWLFSAVREPGAPRARQQELAKQHQAQWQVLFPPAARQPAGGASSSSAAAPAQRPGAASSPTGAA